jgi:hypothetical protein
MPDSTDKVLLPGLPTSEILAYTSVNVRVQIPVSYKMVGPIRGVGRLYIEMARLGV